MTLFSGYVIAKRGTFTSYLEWHPAQGQWCWLASSPDYAHVFSREDATAIACAIGREAEVIPDPLERSARVLPATFQAKRAS